MQTEISAPRPQGSKLRPLDDARIGIASSGPLLFEGTPRRQGSVGKRKTASLLECVQGAVPPAGMSNPSQPQTDFDRPRSLTRRKKTDDCWRNANKSTTYIADLESPRQELRMTMI